MKKRLFLFIILILAGIVIFAFQKSPDNKTVPSKETPPNETTYSPVTITPEAPSSAEKKSLKPICPDSIWGYGYVYPNETLILAVYPSINYIKNSSLVQVYISGTNFTTTYHTSVLLEMGEIIKGRVSLPFHLEFSSPGKLIGITGDALLLQLWRGRAIIKEKSVPVWLYFHVASIKPDEVHLKFGNYTSRYISFKEGPDAFIYEVTITNLYSKPIVIENVSFPLSEIQVYPKPPDIEVRKFRLVDSMSKKEIHKLLPNSTGILEVSVEVPANVSGIYFKPKLIIRVGTERIAVPGPPMEYIRFAECDE